MGRRWAWGAVFVTLVACGGGVRGVGGDVESGGTGDPGSGEVPVWGSVPTNCRFSCDLDLEACWCRTICAERRRELWCEDQKCECRQDGEVVSSFDWLGQCGSLGWEVVVETCTWSGGAE